MFLRDRKSLAVALGALLLAAIGAAALIHRSETRSAIVPAALLDAGSPTPAEAAAADGYYPTTPRPVYVRQPGYEEPAAEQYENAPAPYEVGNKYRAQPRRAARHRRSKKHSIEIVAGSAAAGAAIGAIAGGGKGAAIGGVSGAGAGFVYDRLTH
jgi:uncharacterized protein YcfJ